MVGPGDFRLRAAMLPPPLLSAGRPRPAGCVPHDVPLAVIGQNKLDVRKCSPLRGVCRASV